MSDSAPRDPEVKPKKGSPKDKKDGELSKADVGGNKKSGRSA